MELRVRKIKSGKHMRAGRRIKEQEEREECHIGIERKGGVTTRMRMAGT